MKYLVVIPFRSFGVTFHRGQLVDAAKIRSPRIRVSEGKIIPAVSSSEIPVEIAVEPPKPAKVEEPAVVSAAAQENNNKKSFSFNA